MNKLNFAYLCFEVTRRCNLNCKHCLKGEAQNIDITQQIIDKTLSQVNFIKGLFFTGGEPLLAADKIEYIINKIINCNIPIGSFGIITNGIILDDKITQDFNRLASYMKTLYKKSNVNWKHTGVIGISEDEFHFNDTKKAVDFYKKRCDNSIDIIIKPLNIIDGKRLLVYNGNAKKLSIDNNKYYFMFDNPQHRIQFSDISEKQSYGNNICLCKTNSTDNIFIQCPINVSANGNLEIVCSSSFQDNDKNNMGNIFNVSIAQMIDDWQWKHPLYCREIDLKNKAEANIINNRNNINYNSDDDNSMINDIDTIENKRKELHHNFMYLTFDEIYKITEILIELGNAEKTNDLEKQKLCKKKYGEYERINQEREIQEQFKEHEVIHKKYPNLTPRECEIMDYSIKQINDDWEGYSDKKFVKECKERHKATIKDLQVKNNSRNTLSGLLKEAFIQ